MQNASAAKTQAASFVWTQKLWQISETETETKVLTGIQNSFRGIFSLNQGARGVSIREKVYYKRINVKNCVSRADHCQDGFLQLLTCSCTTVKVHLIRQTTNIFLRCVSLILRPVLTTFLSRYNGDDPLSAVTLWPHVEECCSSVLNMSACGPNKHSVAAINASLVYCHQRT